MSGADGALSGASGGASRVLLVRPEGSTSRAMVQALSSGGLDVHSVTSVFKAVSAFSIHPADLVLFSLAEADDRDLEIIPVLRDLQPDVYILLSFPAERRDLAVRAVAQGADGYVLEPFYLDELLDLVRRALGRSRQQDVTPATDELERLAGAVAHAINNPLQIMELLLSEGSGEWLNPEDFRQEMVRINEVVEELLAFARKDEFRPAPVDLNALVREEIPELHSKRGPVRHRLTPNLPSFTGDERHLRLALSTLARLRRARGTDTTLLVETGVDDRGGAKAVSIRLSAPDLHLSAEERELFFHPFSGPVAGAVGLAAVTARVAVERHGGVIRISSLEGEGTIVTIRFPLMEIRARSRTPGA